MTYVRNNAHLGEEAISVGGRWWFMLLATLFTWGLLVGEGVSQTHLRDRDFLNLGSPEPYLNYGRTPYQPYPKVLTARSQYDRLGNFQMRGYHVFEWELTRPGYSRIGSRRGQYLGWFNNLVIVSDSYRGWNYAATMGEDIRTKLTDLTMNDPRWYGLRLDGASSDNRFTLLLSQGGTHGHVPKFSTFQNTTEQSPVLAFGGRWETQVGSVLRLGATYFNQYMVDTFNPSGSFVKGDTPYSMLPPSFIEVIIEDDSPDMPGLPAIAYGVNVIVTGERMGRPVRLTSIEGDPDFDASLLPRIQGGSVMADGGRQVAGKGDRVYFTFQMPGFELPVPDQYADNPTIPPGFTIRAVRFLADVAGAYRIAVRQQHLDFREASHTRNLDRGFVPGDPGYVNPFTGLMGQNALLSPLEAAAEGHSIFNHWPVRPDPAVSQVNPFLQFKWNLLNPEEVSYTVVRSRGKTGGGNNRQLVEFDYGIPTGQSLYGLDWVIKLEGFTVKGEFSRNPQYFIFPVGRNAGDRHSKDAWAYFVKALREWRSFGLGGEVFQLDPDYSGNYDSARGGIPFFSDRTPTGFPAMQEMYVMTDNDDNDQWPDEHINERPSADKIDSGVFPGLDENMDLIPDTDQNRNGIPDWTEPILFYHADPPEFVYGIDFNNNGVPDFREVDNLPDYPYRRDRKGIHVFLNKNGLGPFGEWASVGMYRKQELAGGTKASAIYARYKYRTISPYFGRLQINNDIKWVKDSIRDDVYVWRDFSDRRIASPYPHLTGQWIQERDLNSQLFPPPKDPLAMRNSMVNNLFVTSDLGVGSDWEISNKFRWMRNSQRQDEFADGTQQEDNTISLIAIVNQASYTIRLGDLTIRPKFKHLLLREKSDNLNVETGFERFNHDRHSDTLRSFSIYAPILRTRYELTGKSRLELGFQGFPFWQHRNLDRVDELNSFSEWTVVGMMTNRSDYYGYNVAFQFGWMKTQREYDEKTMADLNFSNSRLFFDVVAGF